MEFRKLQANEIEIRAQSVKKNGAVFLLYKDARCDMNILDETVGTENWQRNHKVVNGNLFCEVSIWDNEKEQWISKEDVGVESRTEKVKGQASDSFKRACFNWGIGRELYTSPFIWINLKNSEVYEAGKDQYGNIKYRIDKKNNFTISKVEYKDDKISDLEIVDQDGNIRYKMNEYIPADSTKKKEKSINYLSEIRELYKQSQSIVEPLIINYLEERNYDPSDLSNMKKLSNKQAKKLLKQIRKEV